MKIPQSCTDCQDVNTLKVSMRLKDILISVLINGNSLNIFLNIKNVQISSLIYTQRPFHQPVANMLKLAPLRPGLVHLAIFLFLGALKMDMSYKGHKNADLHFPRAHIKEALLY